MDEKYKDKKVIIFDMDGTLTPSLTPMDEEMTGLFLKLLANFKVGVISGAVFKKFETQIIDTLKDKTNFSNLVILPANGTSFFIHKDEWSPLYEKKLTNEEKKNIVDSAEETLKELNLFDRYSIERGKVDDKEGQMTLKMISGDRPIEEKLAWDPDRTRREPIRKLLQEKLPNFEVKIGGTTSIDITPKGADKGYAVKKILEYFNLPKEEALFMGDAIFPGGNDYAAAEIVDSVKVLNPEDTKKVIRSLFEKEKYKIETDTHEFKNLEERPVVYFATEYGITDSLPIYAGGLGVLSGDTFEEASQRGLPFIAIGLLYSEGFKVTNVPLTSIVDPLFAGFTLVKNEEGQEIRVSVPMKEGVYIARVWQLKKNTARLFLLDFSVPENDEVKMSMVRELYPVEFEKKLTQEILLGIGGIRLIKALDIHPSIYHLNEGHTAFALMALACENAEKLGGFEKALTAFKPFVVATKHTPLPDAGLFLSKNDAENFLNPYFKEKKIPLSEFLSKGEQTDPNIFSVTRFLVKNVVRANAVSKMHASAEKKLHEKSELFPITNGVSADRWQANVLKDAGLLRPEVLWREHMKHKEELAEMIKRNTGQDLIPTALTIVWAKRFTPYKRPEIIFNDPEKLYEILNNSVMPVQIIFSGDANTSDEHAVSMLSTLETLMQGELFKGKIIYLPRYSMSLAEILSKGADIWLNTPVPEREACGTSGMKACLNGVLNLTTNGGWVAEAKHQNIGWVLSEENLATQIYAILEEEIIPLFYDRPKGIPTLWIEKMKVAVMEIEKNFSTKRMLEEYVSKLYFPKIEKKS
ncbi:MAG: alpha-glucan family phosphorylase [Candidatus Paceibacterota bacterium]